MPSDSEDILKANAGAPEADIPDLKKKEKERKGAGVVLGAGRVAARAAASAASAAAPAAAVGGQAIWATLAGKLVLAGVAATLGGVGLISYSALKGGGTGVAANLGGITDTLKVRAGGGDRLGVASRGEIQFEPSSASVQKKEEPKEEEKPAEAAAPTDEQAHPAAEVAPGAKDKLAHNLSGAKLSSSLGGDFGGKNIFAGGKGAAPKFNDKMAKINLPKFGPSKGQATTMKTGGVNARASARSVSKGKTSRAIGQLRLAKGMSLLGAGASTAEEAARSAREAFDQQQSHGAELQTPLDGPRDHLPVVNPPNTSMGEPPATPTSTGVDPVLQGMMSQIGSLADQARSLKSKGTALIAIGATMAAIGLYMMLCPASWFLGGHWIIGLLLFLAGSAMVASGQSMLSQADQKKQQADQLGREVAQRTRNQRQAAVVQYCTDQALLGVPPASCNPPAGLGVNTEAYKDYEKRSVHRVKGISDDVPVLSPAGGGR